jgi:hypothetical protein
MKIKKPLINIIILNWNGYDDTIECIDSIKKINYHNWRITIIDNNSTDNSGIKLYKKYEKNPKIKIILNAKNSGFSGGNNLGMKRDLFNADYFLLLNNDTIVEKNFLDWLIKDKKKLIAPAIYDYFSRNELSKNDFPGKFNFIMGGGMGHPVKESTLQRIDYASGCCWLIKKSIFKKTGGFNEKYFAYNEEIEWAYRLNKEGCEFYLNPKAIVWHKGARTSQKISGFKTKYLNRNIIWFERKYADKFQYLLFLLYFFTYKVPKTLFKIISSRRDIKKNMLSAYLGIKEGLFHKIKNKLKCAE